METLPRAILSIVLTVSVLFAAPAQANSFVTFESGQVRPLAMAPDGNQLFAVNTPDNHLEIFAVDDDGLSHTASVAVGLEPVAVAVRNNKEVWVVNHLSDSVSVVDIQAQPPRVIRTLLVGDEPRDIVFAGNNRERAFITTAHRGQNSPYTDQNNVAEAITPGIGRADVWVFDSSNPGTSLGGDALTIVTLFGDSPRALTVSNDGKTVYAAVFHSGNQTTVLHETAVCDEAEGPGACQIQPDGAMAPGGLPGPREDADGAPAPEVGLIVKFDGAHWVDELDRHWDDLVRFNLPDLDVFAIDATANPPVSTSAYAQVGTALFNMAVNPVDGRLFVTNTEAINQVRFEGSREPASNVTTVQGHLHETRISIINPSNGSVDTRHLNKHIDYSESPAPSGVREKSLSSPRGLAFSSDGKMLYVAAKGSDKIGVFRTSRLKNNTFVPDSANHIALPGGGPTGLVLDDSDERLYVLTRFNNSIAVVDLGDDDDDDSDQEITSYALHNPEPERVINGRKFLYNANLTSSNGEASCGVCHIDADFDSLAWDLGDPTGSVINNPGPFLFPGPVDPNFHPVKGPMTTQTLRGLDNHGPMHWRGDRTGGNDEPTVEPDGGVFNEELAFKKFNVAFKGLVGREGPISDADMQAFADFILEVVPPPNPNRNLDDSLNSVQQAGLDVFTNEPADFGVISCIPCHEIDRNQGFFGTNGKNTFDSFTQFFKVPQLRNQYTKVGMFGMAGVPFFLPGNNQHMGDQIRGFGFAHNGATDTLLRFHRAANFQFPEGDAQRLAIGQFLLAFESNMKPIVGQQVTLDNQNRNVVGNRIDLLISQAAAGNCDLVVKGVVGSESRGWYRLPGGKFQGDKAAQAPISKGKLMAIANQAGQPLTFTSVPLGSGVRIGIDRDEDGVWDGDESGS